MNSPQNSEHNNKAFFRYQLILIVLFPVLAIYTVFLAFKYRSLNYLLQRLGFFSNTSENVDIWLHAASVGEMNAAMPLIHAIQKQYPDKKFLVTTTTPTGAELFRKNRINNAVHQYLPLDYVTLISRLFKRYRPKCLLVMETEIWPNLFRTCRKENCYLYIVNGRLSSKTLDTYGWVRSLYQATLKNTTAILTRSETDSKSFVALGADADKVKTIGNIKFSVTISRHEDNKKLLDTPYILAASTHSGEELSIAQLWKQQGFHQSNYLLVLVPRHPNRLNAVITELKPLNLNIAVRSHGNDVSADTDIYIVDTVGELMDFMAGASLVFVGGSLVPIGGHNILEPAALGKPIVFGPYMDNFENEAELLTGFNAAIRVEDENKLAQIFNNALKDPQTYNALGVNARKLMDQYQDTADKYVDEIKSCLA